MTNDLRTELLDFPGDPMERFPAINQHLIAALQSIFPYRPPHPDQSERHVMFEAGRQSVITKLYEVMEYQTDVRR